jgi:hypothetical protein
MTAPNRRWPRFGLRTLFIAVAVFGCWLGYYIHWIRERQVGREWLDAHKTDFIECGMTLEVAIPWPLLEIAGQRDHLRHGTYAPAAPGIPKVQHHHFAAVIGQRARSAIDIGGMPVGGWFTDYRRRNLGGRIGLLNRPPQPDKPRDSHVRQAGNHHGAGQRDPAKSISPGLGRFHNRTLKNDCRIQIYAG